MTQETFVVLADLQIPYHDPQVVDIALQYIERSSPDKVILLGDIFDFPQLTTKFLKEADLSTVGNDIAIFHEIVDRISRTNAEILFIYGNHEDRWRRYVLESAREFSPFMEGDGIMSLQAVLDRPNIIYIEPYDSVYEYRSFHFKHGRRHTKYVAEAELRLEGSSGLSGHKHTFQVFSHADRNGTHSWYSIPCMCHIKGPDVPPGFDSGDNSVRDQLQGFAVVRFGDAPIPTTIKHGLSSVHFDTTSIFNVFPIVVSNGACISPEGDIYVST